MGWKTRTKWRTLDWVVCIPYSQKKKKKKKRIQTGDSRNLYLSDPFLWWDLPCGSVGKESACNAGDVGSLLGLGRSPGEEKGCPLQYSGLENSMGCIVHGSAKSWAWLSDFHFHFSCGGYLDSNSDKRGGFRETSKKVIVNYKLALTKSTANDWTKKAFAICPFGEWTQCCYSCWPSTIPEGIQGGVRHSVPQGIWWDRSLDRCF